MIGIYLIIAFIISGLLFSNRNTKLNNILLVAFLVLQCFFTYYEYTHLSVIELQFFKPDALGILLLMTLTIVGGAAIYHSRLYINDHKENARSRGIYFSAMVLLITAIGAAYLSNHIAVTWIFVEITTLSASALIYHHRNERSLEGTWKYVFICAISVTLIFIGILFLSMAMRQAGSTDLTFDNLLVKASVLNVFWLRLAFRHRSLSLN